MLIHTPLRQVTFGALFEQGILNNLRRFPYFAGGNLEYKSDNDKVELFASFLQETFWDFGSDREFDKTFKEKVFKIADNHKLV